VKISKENHYKSIFALIFAVVGLFTFFSNIGAGIVLIAAGIGIYAWAIWSEYNKQGKPNYYGGIRQDDLMVEVEDIWNLRNNSEAVSMIAALANKSEADVIKLMDQCRASKTSASFYDLPYPTNVVILQGLFRKNGLNSKLGRKPSSHDTATNQPTKAPNVVVVSKVNEVLCKKCGKNTNKYAPHCEHCGLDFRENVALSDDAEKAGVAGMKECAYCKKEINNRALRCRYCLKFVNGVDPLDPTSKDYSHYEKQGGDWAVNLHNMTREVWLSIIHASGDEQRMLNKTSESAKRIFQNRHKSDLMALCEISRFAPLFLSRLHRFSAEERDVLATDCLWAAVFGYLERCFEEVFYYGGFPTTSFLDVRRDVLIPEIWGTVVSQDKTKSGNYYEKMGVLPITGFFLFERLSSYTHDPNYFSAVMRKLPESTGIFLTASAMTAYFYWAEQNTMLSAIDEMNLLRK